MPQTPHDSPPAAGITGSIQGIVKDFHSGAPVESVTVSATSPVFTGIQSAITDAKGFYKIGLLPPGEYLVTFYYADIRVERGHVLVGSDFATPVFQTLNLGRAGGPVVHVHDGAPTLDPIPPAQPRPPVCIYLHTCGTWN